jgi:RHS repeat-associated protein
VHPLRNLTKFRRAQGYDGNDETIAYGRMGNNLKTITYNWLNLPESMNANGALITYTYDANGTKLQKLVSGTVNLNNEYISGIQYEDGDLKYVSTETGRVRRISATSYSYEHTLTDHLGNGRVYFDISGGAAGKIQETDYYAFGLDIQRNLVGVENKFQYNGKEKQDHEKMYDYGARLYDPVIGRWNVMDPLAESFDHISPYNYGMNNPILMVDPDGMAADTSRVIQLLTINIIAKAPKREAFTGFSGNLNYYWNGGHFDGYHYRKDGTADGLSPLMGMPPDLSRGGFSWKSLKSLVTGIRNLFRWGAPKAFLNSLSKSISVQKQARYLLGTSNGGGYLNNLDDAKAVLNAVHSGEAEFVRTMKSGNQVFKFTKVTGTNVNAGGGITNQTNLFMIKGTTSPTIVPINPNWNP